MKPERVEQHLDVFAFSVGCSFKNPSHEHLWIWIPSIPILKNQGLPTFMEGSHRNKGDKADRLTTQFYNQVSLSCLMLDIEAMCRKQGEV